MEDSDKIDKNVNFNNMLTVFYRKKSITHIAENRYYIEIYYREMQ